MAPIRDMQFRPIGKQSPPSKEEFEKAISDVVARASPYPTTKLTNEWIPVPATLLAALKWRENEELELFITHDQLVVRRKGFASDIPKVDSGDP